MTFLTYATLDWLANDLASVAFFGLVALLFCVGITLHKLLRALSPIAIIRWIVVIMVLFSVAVVAAGS